jgi:hypothetical protein
MLYKEPLKDERLGKDIGRNLNATTAIRDQGLKGQLHLGSKRAFNKTIRQTFGMELVKQIVGISIGLQEVIDWTL